MQYKYITEKLGFGINAKSHVLASGFAFSWWVSLKAGDPEPPVITLDARIVFLDPEYRKVLEAKLERDGWSVSSYDHTYWGVTYADVTQTFQKVMCELDGRIGDLYLSKKGVQE